MIGFFDSGYGGLTILKPIIKALPQYDYLYLGDNFRAPYGNYSGDKIQELSDRAVEYLFEQGAKLIIVACNTISATALRHLQEKYLRKPKAAGIKILGIIRPVVEKAAANTKGRIGVIGTRCTIDSSVYDIEIHKINPEIKVLSQACPLLVPLIEENWHFKPEARMILRKYLLPLKSTNIDELILGCTHYPFMKGQIERVMGKKVKVLSPGPLVAKSLVDYLKRHPEIEKLLSTGGKRIYQTTGDPENFQKTLKKIIGADNITVQKVDF